MVSSLAKLKADMEELEATIQSFQRYAEKVIEPFNTKYLGITRIPLRERAIHTINRIAENLSSFCSLSPWPQDFFVVVTPNSLIPMPIPPKREESAQGYPYLPLQDFLSIVENVKVAMELGGLDIYLKHEPFQPPNMVRLLYDAIPPHGKVAAYVSNPHQETDRTTLEEDRKVTQPACPLDQNQDHDGNTGSTNENAHTD